VLLLLLLLVMQHLAAMPQVSSLYAVADMLLDISKLFLLILAPLQGTVLLQPLCCVACCVACAAESFHSSAAL